MASKTSVNIYGNSSSDSSCISMNKMKKSNALSTKDAGAFLLKLLHNGKKNEMVSNAKSQIRNKQNELAENCLTCDIKVIGGGNSSNFSCFTTPLKRRKATYNMNSYNTFDKNSSKPLAAGNPTNFALPMYMRSPNPENIPMPCGFPMEG
ncbi:hypothetical protein ACR3K2_00700 [Cryptosporidium serpentis]